MTTTNNVQYWAEKLQNNNDEIRSLTRKMYDKVDSLSYEELLALRYLLEENGACITLLNEELAKPAPAPRWKTFLRK